jgi:hypothetical protein
MYASGDSLANIGLSFAREIQASASLWLYSEFSALKTPTTSEIPKFGSLASSWAQSLLDMLVGQVRRNSTPNPAIRCDDIAINIPIFLPLCRGYCHCHFRRSRRHTNSGRLYKGCG